MSGPRDVAQRTAGQIVGDASRDWFALLMAGLGLTVSGAEFIGGIVLALAGGAIAAHFRRRQETQHERQTWWVTLLVAAFAGTLAGQASPHILPDWPPQAAMAAAGFASRYLVAVALSALDTSVDEAPNIARRVIDALFRRGGGQP